MLKYVMLNGCYPVLFPQAVVHRDVADSIGGRKVTSAGFCQLVAGKVEVWGESISLRLSSQKEDASFIERAIKELNCE